MLNKVQIIGRLATDPEVRFLANGEAACRVRVACGEVWKNKDGTQGEHTEWFTAKLFGRPAEIVGEYGRKGKLMYFEGQQRTEEYEDKQGNKKSEVTLRVRDFKFLQRRETDDDGNAENKGGARDSGNTQRTARRDAKAEARPARGAPPTTGPAAVEGFADDDDIPF